MGIFSRRTVTPTREIEAAPPPQLPHFRAPSVSTLSVKYGGSATALAMAKSVYNPVRAVNEQYLCNTYLYAAIRALGEDLSSLSLRCGPDPEDAQNFDTKHPLIKRLGPSGRPNPSATTARQLWQWTVAQYIVTGKFGWEIDRGDGSLWPLIANRINPVSSDGGTSYFQRFDYDVGQGQQKRLQPDQVIYHWRPSVNDWRQPESVLQSARLDVSVAVMQDLYDFAFLSNDARPAAIVVHEAFNNEDERDAWRRQFLESHRGASNAGKMAFAEASADGALPKDALFVQTIGLSQKDAEFIRRYEAKIAAMLVAVGVPAARLGNASGKTFANAGEEMHAYWKSTVRQLAIDFADAVNVYLAPRYGPDLVWWDFSENEYLREAPKFTVADAIAAYQAGLITMQEARVESLEMPAEPDGELMPPPVAPPALPPPPPQLALPAAAAGLTPEAVAVLIREALERQEHDEPAVIHGELEEVPEARRARLWRAFDVTLAPIERRWIKKWDRMFTKQQDAVLSRLTGKRGRQALREATPNVDAVFDMAFWTAALTEMGIDMYDDTVAAAFQAFQTTVGISFDLDAPFARGFIERRANQLAGFVNTTTYDGIKKALADGAAEGEGIPQLADRIRHLFQQTYANRAETVARTEVISGYNGGTHEASLQTNGVVDQEEWLATLDRRCRKAHIAADGQRVALGDLFDVGGELLRYPGDPNGSAKNIVNCRCALSPVVAEDATFGHVIPFDRAARLAVAVARGDARIDNPGKVLGIREKPPVVVPGTIELMSDPGPQPVEIVVRVTDQPKSVRKTVEYDDEGNISAIVEEAI